VVITHTVPYVLILYLSSFNRLLWVLTSSYILKVSISLRLLLIHVRNVEFGLRSGDINYARQYVSGIVRRDVSKLGEGHIASATIESLFESLVDGFTSPLLYYTFLGPIGALLQRLVNSLDSALGYRTDEFINTGWFSAKVDTIINYIPSRVTSLLIILLCPLVNGSLKRSLTTYLRDRGKTESVNAGSIFASVSGCLSVKLEKVNIYCIGSEFNLPKHEDISKSVRLALITTTSYIFLTYLLFTTYNTFLEGGLIA
ncbi:MAG: cobalamin biosynthesis protein, partial [Sulfolobales archaeon]